MNFDHKFDYFSIFLYTFFEVKNMKFVFEDFEIIKRSGNIIFSSPHAHRQYRNGKVKSREFRTGTLSKIVSSKTKSSCIYRTKFAKNDPNYDKESIYKSELVDFIKENNISTLFDIHGMRAERDFDICIGTGLGKNIFHNNNLLDLVIQVFKKYGFNHISIDEPFNACYPYTVSSFVARKAKIPCFQIEINNKYTYKKYDTFNFNNLVNCFTELTHEVSCFLKDNGL